MDEGIEYARKCSKLPLLGGRPAIRGTSRSHNGGEIGPPFEADDIEQRFILQRWPNEGLGAEMSALINKMGIYCSETPES